MLVINWIVIVLLGALNFVALVANISEVVAPFLRSFGQISLVKLFWSKLTKLHRFAKTPSSVSELRTWCSDHTRDFLGIPRDARLDDFVRHIRDRYCEKTDSGEMVITVSSWDRIAAYMERIIDRQINKSRGLLPFNSILLVVIPREFESKVCDVDCTLSLHTPPLHTLAPDTPPPTFSLPILHSLDTIEALCFASIVQSSVLLLTLLWIHWGDVDHYKTFSTEVEQTAAISRNRSVILDLAIVLSGGALAGMVVRAFYSWGAW
jgi:hypothetical protein